MSLTNNNVCDKCNTRVPKNRPKLICSLCNLTKHYKCQTLSKTDACNIIRSLNYQWTCYECLSGILPVNVCRVSRTRSNNSNTITRFNTKCHSCDGQSYYLILSIIFHPVLGAVSYVTKNVLTVL